MRARDLLPDRKPASQHPDLVRQIAAGGHTIGTHTWLHRSLKQMPFNEAKEEIDHGISAVEEGAARGGDHHPEHAVLSLSRLCVDAGDARSAAIARHRGVRRRFLGQRLESA
jgi:peptidoglycan/xylan/chitin deacetylase (PgdA/CDA1 family)